MVWDEVGWAVGMGRNKMGWDEMGQGGRSGTLLEVQNLWAQGLSPPQSLEASAARQRQLSRLGSCC